MWLPGEGCVQGVSVSVCVSMGGVSMGVSAHGGVCPGMVCVQGGVPQCMLGYTPPVNRMTDRQV